MDAQPRPRRQSNPAASANGTSTVSGHSILPSTSGSIHIQPLSDCTTSIASLISVVKPILHRLVQIILDYQTFSTLCKEYLKKLDTNFALVASQRMVELCREIHKLVEKRAPLAEQFMVTTFHQTIKLFNVSVKRALHGDFGDLDNQFVQLLQQSYQLTTLLKGEKRRRHSRGERSESDASAIGEGEVSAITPNRLKSSRSASSIFYNGYTSIPPAPPPSKTVPLSSNTGSMAATSSSFRNSLPCPAAITIPQGQTTTNRPKSFLVASTSQQQQQQQANRENLPPARGNTDDGKQLDANSAAGGSLTNRKRSSKNMRVSYSSQSTPANTNANNTLKPTEWQCIKCKVKNDRGGGGGGEKCNMCGEPRPVLQLNTKQTLGEIEPDIYNSKWICKKCKIPNMLSADTCVFCSLPRCAPQTTVGLGSSEQRELRSVRRSRSANGLRPTIVNQ